MIHIYMAKYNGRHKKCTACQCLASKPYQHDVKMMLSWQNVFLAVEDDKGYCYTSSDCQGSHKDDSAEVLKSECCDILNGMAWGKAGEESCEPCETTNPILPGVISK